MIDLTTHYMGLELFHPIVPSASPLSYDLDGICRLEDAGAPAIVLFSLFEEQIEMQSRALDYYLNYGAESYVEATSYFPESVSYEVGPESYLELIRSSKDRVNVPIIASLNGVSSGGWVRYGRMIQEAGASALELNIYYIPTDPDVTSQEIERQYVDVVAAVAGSVSIPVAVKLGPFFTSPVNMGRQLASAGANGLTLFNRFYQPDFDIQNLEVIPNLVLSRSYDMRLPLHWIALMHGQVAADLALTGGVHTYTDVLKAMMAGARVAQVASELLAHGVKRIREMQSEMIRWMEEYEYESVRQMQGSMSRLNVADPSAFERANYMRVLQSFKPDPTGKLI